MEDEPLSCQRCGAAVVEQNKKMHAAWHNRLNKKIQTLAGRTPSLVPLLVLPLDVPIDE